MNKGPSFTQRHGRQIVALAAITGLYWAARLPQVPQDEIESLAGRYDFRSYTLVDASSHDHKNIRKVHPSLEHIDAWISSVGASVALNDLDGDGLSNDVCHVDPRTDLVTISPAPGTAARYAPFQLNPAPLPYDASTMAPMGTMPGDYNEDGQTDVLVYYWGRTPVIFLGNGSGGTLTAASYTPVELTTSGERWFTNCATVADLDGDGHNDLVIGNYFPDGADVLNTKGAGIQEMQASMSRAFNGGYKRLMLWAGATTGSQPAVRFRDASSVLPADVSRGWTLGVGAADLDGDMRPELYFANDFGPDRLLHNRSTPGKLAFTVLEGKKKFTTPNSKVLGRDSFKGMGVDFADVNRDGLLDIYVSNIAGEYSLEESHFLWVNTGDTAAMNQGTAPFMDLSEPLGLSRSSWGWESRLADFNNDGMPEAVQATGFARGTRNRWPELHELATSNDQLLDDPRCWFNFHYGDDLSGGLPNPFFAYHESGRYVDIATEIGLGRPMVSRGIATSDVDGDGLLDFAVANQWDTSFFYHNQAPNPGSYIGLHLMLPVGGGHGAAAAITPGHPGGILRGRPAIGAQVVLHLAEGKTMIAQVDGGNGHSGKRSPDLHFGLGSHPANVPVRAEITWRDSGGQVRRTSMEIMPGWHTVMLGSQTAGVQS